LNPLAHADFRRLAFGAGFTSIGFQGEQVLVSMLLFQITGSTAWVGIGLAMSFLPMLLVGVPAGATADHFDRRRLLPIFEACLVAVFGLTAWLIWDGETGVPALLTLVFITGTLRAMHFPVRLSYAQDLLGSDRLVKALGVLGVLSRIGQLIGAVLAGSLLERAGPGVAFAGLAVAHMFSVIMFMRLEHQGKAHADGASRPTLRQNFKEYARELLHNPLLLRLTLLASLLEIFGFSFVTALPELATVQLGIDAEGVGLLHGARSAGGLLAALLLVGYGTELRRGYAYIAILMGFGVALLVLAWSPVLWIGMLACALVALFAASGDVLSQAMMQASVPDHLRGRAMGAWVLALGAGPIGHVELGMLTVAVGAPAGLVLNGVVLIATGLWVMAALPRIRRL
jgi:MFS family permease